MQSTEAIRLRETAEIVKAYGLDPILAARQLFPHWFSKPMPWFHRGLIAIYLRRADFLLNFGEEQWADGSARWTKKKLAKLVRCFRYKVNPKDPRSPELPIFRPVYDASGRKPISIDMVLGNNVCTIIPRGFGKTTIVDFCNIYKTLYKLTKFTVYVSESQTHAEDRLATIRRELSSNERIIALFGKLKPERDDDEVWGAKGFETTTGVKFSPKGRGSQIRGMNKFGDRPDTIVLDDVEDKESVQTEEQRQKVLSWHISDVEQALSRNNPGCIYAIGTILHAKALLPTLAESRSYTSIILGAIDPEGDMLWEDGAGLSREALRKKEIEFAEKGKGYEFALEFLSVVDDAKKLKFRQEYIRYRQMSRDDFVQVSMHVDPAISDKPGADFFAIAVVGITALGHKHVLDMFMQEGVPFSDQAEEIFRLKLKWKPEIVSIESTAYQKALVHSVRAMMFQKAKDPKYRAEAYFEIRETYPRTSKVERVEGILQPIMASGYLTFQMIWPELELMLTKWPNEKLDGPDAIASAIANFEPLAPLSGNEDSLEEAGASDTPIKHEAPCAAGRGHVP